MLGKMHLPQQQTFCALPEHMGSAASSAALDLLGPPKQPCRAVVKQTFRLIQVWVQQLTTENRFEYQQGFRAQQPPGPQQARPPSQTLPQLQ